MNKKAQSNYILDIIFGLIVISGGVLILFRYITLGSLITSIGLVFELIKTVVEQGVK